MHKNRSGFTLVELLIVIVVIAILASISVVAYSGIQQRASRSQLSAALDSYIKGIEMYRVENGVYPTASDLSHTGYACLAPAGSLPASGVFEDDKCSTVDGYGEISPALNTKLSTIVSDLPDVSMPAANYSSTNSARGLMYYASDDWVDGRTWYAIHYYILGNQECPRGDSYYLSSTNVTQCYVDPEYQ